VVPTVAGKVSGILATTGRAISRLVTACADASQHLSKLQAAREKAGAIWEEIKKDVKSKRDQDLITLHVRATLAAAPFSLKPEQTSAVCNPIGLRVRTKAPKGLQVPEDKILSGVDFLLKVYPSVDDALAYSNRLRDRLREIKAKLVESQKETAAKKKAVNA
jgi:hypothetical protein